MAKVGRDGGGQDESHGNINDPHALLSHKVIWYDLLIDIILSMYEKKIHRS